MSLTIQDAALLTGSKAAFNAADQTTINALKDMTGLSQTAGCMWVRPFTVAIDTSALTFAAAPDITDVVAKLAEKDILMLFRKGHTVTHTQGPQCRGPPESMFADTTAHTVATVAMTREAVTVTITIKPPINSSRAASAAAAGFR